MPRGPGPSFHLRGAPDHGSSRPGCCIPRSCSDCAERSPSQGQSSDDGHQRGLPPPPGAGHGPAVYWPDTNVLVKPGFAPDGWRVIRYMPVEPPRGRHQWLVRRVRLARGSHAFRLDCRPPFNYARDEHQTESAVFALRFHSPSLSLDLVSPCRAAPGRWRARESPARGESLEFASAGRPGADRARESPTRRAHLPGHRQFWRGCSRSALTSDAGARWCTAPRSLEAADLEPRGRCVRPTCSLPERLALAQLDYR